MIAWARCGGRSWAVSLSPLNTPRVAKASPLALSMVTALWVGSTCRPPAIGSVATLYRISPDSSTRITASDARKYFAGNFTGRSRGQDLPNCKAWTRDFRSTLARRKFARDDAKPVLTSGHRSLKPAAAERMAECRSLNQLIARWETLRSVADTRTAICRARVRSEAHICCGVTLGSAPAGLASAVRSASLFSSEEDNLRLQSEP